MTVGGSHDPLPTLEVSETATVPPDAQWAHRAEHLLLVVSAGAARTADRRGDTMTALEAVWRDLVKYGIRSGHVLCECPTCGFRRMASYRPKSKPWPVCSICHPGYVSGRIRSARGLTRMVPISDVAAVRKNPGKPRTKKQLEEDAATCD